MPDREKVIKGLECHAEVNCVECPYRDGWRTCPFGETLLADALALLKEQEAQKQSILKNIADNQLANSPDEWQSPEQRMYSKGVFDGLQMAYEMLAYGVVKKDA